MNRISFINLFYLFLSSILLVSCSWPIFSDKEKKFKEIVPIQNINTTLRFNKPDTTYNSFKIGDSVELDLINNSNDTIILNSGYGLEIYYFNENINDWVKVSNKTTYLFDTSHPSVPPNKPDDFHFLSISINPMLDRYFAQVTIRVVVKGQIIQSDPSKDEAVGAYIDVPLHQ